VSAFKLALVADIHHGAEKLTKKGTEALGLLDLFIKFANDYGADLVVDLGDRISDVDRETDRELTGEVAAAFQRVSAPRRHLVGNHDVEFMTVTDGEELLGVPLTNHSLDLGGYHLVFWQADTHVDIDDGFILQTSDLDWLADDLGRSDLPSIVFSHVPLDAASMAGNFYFEANPRHAAYDESHAIQKVLREAGNVILCVAGHVHWNKVNVIDGIPYLSLQSLTESFTTAPAAAAAWATIEIGDDIHWRVHGADPLEIRLPLRRPKHRWTPPLPSFHSRRARLARQREGDPLAGVRGVLFDLDGVVYRGDEVVPGATAFFDYLSETDRVVGAITNNARHRAADYSAKLAGMGIRLPPERIFTSGWAAARHIAAQSERPAVFVAGSDALGEELRAAGTVASDTPDFVVASFDHDMPLSVLSTAVKHVRSGACLVVTNPDRTLPTPSGLEPESGAVAAFLEAATSETATIIGKPMRTIFDLALAGLGLLAEETLMIGDTPETDIKGGNGARLRTVLVESGNPDDGSIEPTLRMPDLTALHDAFRGTDTTERNDQDAAS
jgi:HAD superfamily hydrolase (TIGR01450 family)